MFNIAIDESGETCNSHELVKNKSASKTRVLLRLAMQVFLCVV